MAETRVAQLLPSPTAGLSLHLRTQRRARRAPTRLIYKILATPFVLEALRHRESVMIPATRVIHVESGEVDGP